MKELNFGVRYLSLEFFWVWINENVRYDSIKLRRRDCIGIIDYVFRGRVRFFGVFWDLGVYLVYRGTVYAERMYRLVFILLMFFCFLNVFVRSDVK